MELKQAPFTSSYAGIAGAATPARDRDPNCIENYLQGIEIGLAESLNSAINLADKLAFADAHDKRLDPNGNPPAPSNVQSRLAQIAETIRGLNQQLGRSHNAISG